MTAYDLARISPDAATYGRKAAALATLSAEGLRIPEGFVLDAAACDAFHQAGDGRLPTEVDRALQQALSSLEQRTGLVLVWAPATRFTMGHPSGEPGREHRGGHERDLVAVQRCLRLGERRARQRGEPVGPQLR